MDVYRDYPQKKQHSEWWDQCMEVMWHFSSGMEQHHASKRSNCRSFGFRLNIWEKPSHLMVKKHINEWKLPFLGIVRYTPFLSHQSLTDAETYPGSHQPPAGAFPKIRGIPTGSQPMPPEAPASLLIKCGFSPVGHLVTSTEIQHLDLGNWMELSNVGFFYYAIKSPHPPITFFYRW